MVDSFNSNERLILACARTHLTAGAVEDIGNAVRQPLDWDWILRAADRHGVLPLIYSALQTAGLEALPRPAAEGLRSRVEEIKRQNLFLSAELLRLLRLLDRHGVRALPIKGPVLVASTYGSLAARQFADLDIIVALADVRRTKDLLLKDGYQTRSQLTPAIEAAFLRSNVEYELVRGDGRVFLDLHWGITTGYLPLRVSFDDLWQRRVTISLSRTDVPSLCPSDTALVVCVHGCKARWSQLKWIVDVAEWLRCNPEMDWTALFKQASALGATRRLLLGLLLASKLLGAGLPKEARGRISSDRRLEPIAHKVVDLLFSANAKKPAEIDLTVLQFQVSDRLRDKLAFCLRLALLPNHEDAAVVSLPSHLAFLYFPIRPIRLLGKYGRRLLYRLSGRRFMPPPSAYQ
jgi:hypothetical protein